MIARTMKARVLLFRGRTAEAAALEAEYLPRAQEAGDIQALCRRPKRRAPIFKRLPAAPLIAEANALLAEARISG